MKRFIVSVLCVSVFFIGLGNLVESVGARFKSDEKALELLRLARQAIGGEANIKAVQSMTITGRATKTFNFNGESRIEQGDWELNLQLPNKLSKMMKIQIGGNGTGERIASDEKDVVIIKKGESDKTFERMEVPNGENVKKVVVGDELRASIDKMEHNDLFRTTLSLLLTAPQDVNAEYVFVGEGSVDGSSVNIIEARVGDSPVRLYLDKSSNLPRMISYLEHKPLMFFKIRKGDENVSEDDAKTFTRKVEAPEKAEFQIKFADYRNVNGIQLPFKWTQTVGGQPDETIEISAYELNPANIADKFNNQPQKIMMRMKKEQ